MSSRIPLPRIVLAAILASACVLGAASPAFAVNPFWSHKIAGPDRYATSVEISKNAWGSASAVIVTTGMNWPDALGGASFAGYVDAPILLVKKDSVPTVVSDEITRLGATYAYILGGESVVSPAVEAQLEALVGAGNVHRFAGADRYETANILAQQTITRMNLFGPPFYDGWAFVATSDSFPDALSASPLSAYNGWPIFLANPHADTVPTAFMKSQGVTDVIILGGDSAVSLNQQAALAAEFPMHVYRISGPDRYSTSVAIAEYSALEGLNWDSSGLATGEQFPDALAGGAMFGGRFGSVLLITPTAELADPVAAKYQTLQGTISDLYFVGGNNAISENVQMSVNYILH